MNFSLYVCPGKPFTFAQSKFGCDTAAVACDNDDDDDDDDTDENDGDDAGADDGDGDDDNGNAVSFLQWKITDLSALHHTARCSCTLSRMMSCTSMCWQSLQ